MAAELEASSTPKAAEGKAARPPSNTVPAGTAPAPALVAASDSHATSVAEAVQQLHDMGWDDGHVPAALQYYAAASTNHASSTPAVPEEVVSHPSFQQVLAWLQHAGVGPEDVAAYLARQQQLAPVPVAHEQRWPPTVGAHAVWEGDDDVDNDSDNNGVEAPASSSAAAVITSPLRSVMAHFADAGMPPALVVAALQSTPDGAAALAAHALKGLEGQDTVAALAADTPEARGAAALQFAAVLSHLEEEGVAPGDLAAMIVAERCASAAPAPDASSSDVLPVRVLVAKFMGPVHCVCTTRAQEVCAPADGLAALLEHFASLGVLPAQLHMAMGSVLHAALGRGTPTSDAWVQTSVQRIAATLQGAEADALRMHVLRDVGGGTHMQQLADRAMQAAHGDAASALAILRRCAGCVVVVVVVIKRVAISHVTLIEL